jgi:hypothetical protein
MAQLLYFAQIYINNSTYSYIQYLREGILPPIQNIVRIFMKIVIRFSTFVRYCRKHGSTTRQYVKYLFVVFKKVDLIRNEVLYKIAIESGIPTKIEGVKFFLRNLLAHASPLLLANLLLCHLMLANLPHYCRCVECCAGD